MRKCFLIHLLITCTLFLPDEASAQNYADAGLWGTLSADIKLNPRYSVVLAQEWRMEENFSRLNLFYTNLGLERRIWKMKTSLIYRFVQKYQEDNTFSFRHRLMWDISWKKKIGQFEIGYRHRLQSEKRDIFSSENGRVAEWYSRSKLNFKFDSERRIFPYGSAEVNYQIKEQGIRDGDMAFHRIRYQIGFDYKLNESQKIGVYYLIQNEFNLNDPQSMYIAGFEYGVEF